MTKNKLLTPENTQLLIIDVQGKLSRIVYDSEKMINNISTLIQGCQLFDMPITWMEHCPDKLGGTIPEIASLMPDEQAIPKRTFSAYQTEACKDSIKKQGRINVIIIGIETHICVYQTACELLEAGYNVHLPVDCVSSRTLENKNLGIERLKFEGVKLTCVETVLYELLKTAENERFKPIIRLVK